MTRNESQLTVRQSTAVNPHVVPLVAAKIQLLPSMQQRRRDDFSLTEDDLPRGNGRRRQHLKWCGPKFLWRSMQKPLRAEPFRV